MNDEDDIAAELPEDLVRRLRAAEERQPLISARVDRALDELAREQFAKRPAAKPKAAPRWLAVAASVLLALAVFQNQRQDDLPADPAYGDVDGSGRVDIVDVFTLARGGDPRVSQEDLDAFARRVVALRDAS